MVVRLLRRVFEMAGTACWGWVARKMRVAQNESHQRGPILDHLVRRTLNQTVYLGVSEDDFVMDQREAASWPGDKHLLGNSSF